MKKEDTVGLNTHSLNKHIQELALKQWWIARQIGVDRKTVSRWVTGRVKRMSRANAVALSELLSCPLSDITVSDECDVLATQEEQRIAAELIEKEDLLQILSATDHWPLAESLIKASMLAHLPKRQMGQLYNLLSIAAWRQGHYDEGRQRAERALDLSQQIGDPFIAHKAQVNIATIESLTGRVDKALEVYESCIKDPQSFAKQRDLGSAYSNLGCLYRSFKRFDESVVAQETALELFNQQGIDLNAAISCFSLGVVFTEMNRYDAALSAFKNGEIASLKARYERGKDCAALYSCDPLSMKGETDAARDILIDALPKLDNYPVYDLGLREIAARVFRRAGDMAKAREQLNIGLERSKDFPEIEAFMRFEEARYLLTMGKNKLARAAQESGTGAFLKATLNCRAEQKSITEYGLENVAIVALSKRKSS
ncbi:MAG: tetratricopeptide repeat protein [Planctomycetota bacterium]|nr:tetratricopeptide repeat protein [Planctomycetota bacterium]